MANRLPLSFGHTSFVADPPRSCYGDGMGLSSRFICPHCQQSVDIAPHSGQQFVYCPHCNAEFSLPHEQVLDERAAELDGLRIRQLSTLRRAAYRSRSYAIIAAGACAVVAAQLVLLTIRHVRTLGWSAQAIGYVLLVPVAAWGAWYFLGRAMALHRETRRTLLTNPTQPPDFSTLSDGSQQVKNLEDIR
jgi:hypothetical protein